MYDYLFVYICILCLYLYLCLFVFEFVLCFLLCFLFYALCCALYFVFLNNYLYFYINTAFVRVIYLCVLVVVCCYQLVSFFRL
jgi:hypothetical protein